VPFDHYWDRAVSSRAALRGRPPTSFAPRTGTRPRRRWAKVVKALPRAAPEARAARYLLALSQANQSKWTEAGSLFEDPVQELPQAGPVPRLQRRPLSAAARRPPPARLEWARGRVGKGSIPEAETNLVAIDGAARALGRWDDVLASVRRVPGTLPQRPAPRRGVVQEGRGAGEGRTGAAAPASRCRHAGGGRRSLGRRRGRAG